MATNKRTDSAALFELIDKSTLKVPKTAGSLKIPSWWSSKTNPASPSPSSVPTTTPASTRPAPAPLERSPALAAKPSPTISPNGTSHQAEPAPAAKPINGDAASPTIRPPARAPVPTPARRPSSGVFAPQTHDQSAPVQGQTRGAPPLWLILAGTLAVVAILIGSVVAIMRGRHQTPVTPAHMGSEGTGVTVIPAPDSNTGSTGNSNNQQQQPPQNQTPGQARVIPFTDVKRTPGYVYFVIFTANETAANSNAEYLAQHGISTSVRQSPTNPKMFQVISVDGFPGVNDPKGKAFRTQIVTIGRSHPDAKKAGKGVYEDVYFTNPARPQ